MKRGSIRAYKLVINNLASQSISLKCWSRPFDRLAETIHARGENLSFLTPDTAFRMTVPSTQEDKREEMRSDNFNLELSAFAFYNHSRAHSVLTSLSNKPKWTNADTSSFDCLHYDGDAALDHCASKLHLQPDQRVLDIGSGFSATGRFLASNYGAHVTGIELQRNNHELARIILARNVDPRVVERVRSVYANILGLTPDKLYIGSDGDPSSTQFDHVVSLLCITHIPESARAHLFRQAARFLKPGGRLYIEDFYDKSCHGNSPSNLTKRELHQLRDIVACPYLPSARRYVADVTAAGFDSIEFEDVSEKWTQLLCARSEKYQASKTPNAALQEFYATVAELFEGKNVGGVRLTATRK